jgi:hypothetical protein
VVSRYLNPLDVGSIQGAFPPNAPRFASAQLTKNAVQELTSKLDLTRIDGELRDLVSQLLEKVSPGKLVESNPT